MRIRFYSYLLKFGLYTGVESVGREISGILGHALKLQGVICRWGDSENEASFDAPKLS